MSLNETQNTNLVFSSEELEKIQFLTQEYQVIMREALTVQSAIDNAQRELAIVVEKSEKVKSEEMQLFEEMSVKYDLEIKTLQNIVANRILNGNL